MSGYIIYTIKLRKYTKTFPVETNGSIIGVFYKNKVEELVEAGELDPDQIHTPGIYVHRIFQGENYEKRIEQRTVRPKK